MKGLVKQYEDSYSHRVLIFFVDDDFLGAFASFSPDDFAEAQNRLLKLLTSQKEHLQWFENLDPTDPDIQKVFDGGYFKKIHSTLLPSKPTNY
jgi:hypothetical protein